jgi:transcriptional regulator with XRE-family HTH domain
MRNEPYEVSERAAIRIRAFRKTRRISAELLAEKLTKAGYPITRSALANFENGRFRTVPLDLVVAAMKVFEVGFGTFMQGPLCGTCADKPPLGFGCQTCKRTMTERGELVAC